MRVSDPDIKDRNKLFAHLKANKDLLMAQKCSAQVTSDNFDYGCLELRAKDLSFLGKSVTKSKVVKEDLGEDEIQVDAIANMAGWCDSYMDVLIPDCWAKTIREKGASNKQLIYHLKNHDYTTDAIIGGNVNMSSKWVDLSMFNIESDLTQGQALIGSSTVRRKYDAKCYHLYSDDEVKQHSIGLRYIKIYLCMNSDEDEYQFEKENWDKYYKFIINKDKVDGRGYFWAVTEIKLLEYSAVLYGANELTTVQSTGKNGPSEDTQMEPLENTLDYASLAAQI
ncbi:hypothetical protein J0X14_14260 [Muricauda sp. CAU 1633]|uniref:hypothetical protein n=1 Tax=Allomuricauda sp. CAU 1633 TaxID=2816036 RepID=UPI001A907067|nr:hypothetical protein [Muricauda sp. CAU 1633]MBO0323468.1 hypothetical protein [Muricauda sp. CAU 1633]